MRLLIIRLSSLGDTVLTTGVINELHKKIPNADIDVLTFTEFASVWKFCPSVSTIYTVDRGVSLMEYYKFLKSVPKYDHIFDLHANLRSMLASWLVKGKAHNYSKNSICRRLFVKLRLCRGVLQKHTVEKYALGIFPALQLPMPYLEALRPWLYVPKAVKVKGRVIIHPFASKFTKIWQHFPELVHELSESGLDVYIVGSDNSLCAKGAVHIDTQTIDELINFMSSAEVVVSTDSGPLHISVGLGIPTVAIFGSTTKELGFFPKFDGCKVIENSDVACRPCHIHGRVSCPKGHFRCMDISVDTVLEAVWTILKR